MVKYRLHGKIMTKDHKLTNDHKNDLSKTSDYDMTTESINDNRQVKK